MDTCDILLMRGKYNGLFGIWTYIVHLILNTEWTHVGIILKNPTYIDKKYCDGLYLLESGSEQCSSKFGVQINKLDDIIESKSYYKLAYRKLICNFSKELIEEKLKVICNTTKDKPYDTNVLDLIGIAMKNKLLISSRKLDKFVCSTLVGYVYTELDLLDSDTNWSFFTPKDFTSENNIKLLHGAHLQKEILI